MLVYTMAVMFYLAGVLIFYTIIDDEDLENSTHSFMFAIRFAIISSESIGIPVVIAY